MLVYCMKIRIIKNSLNVNSCTSDSELLQIKYFQFLTTDIKIYDFF